MSLLKALTYAAFAVFCATASFAADEAVPGHVIGKASAPVKVDEYMSLTCTHCAQFLINVWPELEKKYIETGKVRVVIHDFPIDGIALKAAAVARCMPPEQYFPFIKLLFGAQNSWITGNGDPMTHVIQYAKLGGLPEAKAKECANDGKIQDAILADRTAAGDKYKISGTPSFVINDGAETIPGMLSVENFSATFDRYLAAKK